MQAINIDKRNADIWQTTHHKIFKPNKLNCCYKNSIFVLMHVQPILQNTGQISLDLDSNPIPRWGGGMMQLCITLYILFDTVEVHGGTILKLFYF